MGKYSHTNGGQRSAKSSAPLSAQHEQLKGQKLLSNVLWLGLILYVFLLIWILYFGFKLSYLSAQRHKYATNLDIKTQEGSNVTMSRATVDFFL